MQLSFLAVLSVAALALGNPASNANVKARQVGAAAGAAAGAAKGPTVQQPAMTDQQGNIVNFDATKVYMAGQDAGLKGKARK